MRVWYSDNRGESYIVSPDVLQPGSEPSIAAVNDSFVSLVARSNSQLGCACQEATDSRSGGARWTAPIRNASGLPSTYMPPNGGGCQGSVTHDPYHTPASGGRLLYTGPRSTTRREGMSIWQSQDDGRTWSLLDALSQPGVDASYSCLAATPSAVHVLWETGPDAAAPCTGAACRIVLSTRARRDAESAAAAHRSAESAAAAHRSAESTTPTRYPQAAAQRDGLMALYHATGGARWSHGKGWGSPTDPCTWQSVCCGSNVTEQVCGGDNIHRITGLYLGSNTMAGTLPSNASVWSALSSLRMMNIRTNQLSGTMPPALGELSALRYLNARRNPHLSGTLPSQLGRLTDLVHLSVRYNSLSGSVPSQLGGLRRLGTGPHSGFDLSNNLLSGVIPSSLSAGTWPDGRVIGLGGIGSAGCPTGDAHCNHWRCPIPPIRLANGTANFTGYATCDDSTLMQLLPPPPRPPAVQTPMIVPATFIEPPSRRQQPPLQPGGPDCGSDLDCQLLGSCHDGRCTCDPGWTGRHCGTLKQGTSRALWPRDSEVSASWGASILTADDGKSTTTHELFADVTCLANTCAHTNGAQIIHASSRDGIRGPYSFVEVAIPAEVANVHAARSPNGTTLLYYGEIGTWSNATCTGSSSQQPRAQPPRPREPPPPPQQSHGRNPPYPRHVKRMGIAYKHATDEDGARWRYHFPLYDASLQPYLPLFNPSPVVLAGGRTLLAFRYELASLGETIGLAEAETWEGPYRLLTAHATPGEKAEDPHLFLNARGYHAVFHCYRGNQTGCHAYSTDGVRWHVSKEPVYDTRITFDNGTRADFWYRERPALVFDGPRPTHLLTGVEWGPKSGDFGSCASFSVITSVLS